MCSEKVKKNKEPNFESWKANLEEKEEMVKNVIPNDL
jgi:hypothetical protein